MFLNNLVANRKDIAISANIKMKQLQWDKLPHQQVSKTAWNEEKPERELDWIKKLKEVRVWEEMEEDFQAKQIVINLMGKSSC